MSEARARARRVDGQRARPPSHPSHGRDALHELRAVRPGLPGHRLHRVRGASRSARMTTAVAPGPRLMKGNEAMADAAIEAGCDAYFGYPITPQAELLERMAKRMPELGRTFVQ